MCMLFINVQSKLPLLFPNLIILLGFYLLFMLVLITGIGEFYGKR